MSFELPGRRGRFTRMGVVNLYEYANEVFVFEDGKLVIKGANGVGKSRALELTYPLLLEGDLAEHRVDTTGKQGRPFAWNLSLGDVYPRRIGYAWLEALVPVGDDGETEHVTIGMGASGGQSGGNQTIDSKWFFILRGTRLLDPARNVGDVDVAPEGQPLNRRALTSALGTSGRTFTTAADYRRAVNDALFGFASMDAYQSMVNLLFLLRRPKLAEVLNPDVFHEQLTASLPELQLNLIKEGADRLDALERMRSRIEGLRADREASLAFGEVYGRYAQRLAHERATRLLEAERLRRGAVEDVAKFRREQEELVRVQALHASQAAEADARRGSLEGHRDALQRKLDSPGAQRLKEATAAARAAEQNHATLSRRVGEITDDRVELLDEERQLQADADQAAEQLATAQTALETRFRACGVPAKPWPAEPEALVAHVADAERDRGHREQLLRRAAQLETELDRVDDELDRAERHVGALVETLKVKQAQGLEAGEALETARREVEDLVEWWARELVELAVDDDALTQLLAGLDGESGALDLTVVAAAHDDHRDRTQALHAEAEHRLSRLEVDRGAVDDELERLAEGLTGSPERASWRAPGDAPALWELVDFADRLTAAQRDGLEAALDVSGLLTGTPAADGVRAADGQLLLQAGTPVSGRSLADVLVAESEDAETLRTVLASVAVVDADADAVVHKRGPVVLGLDGSCGVGPIRARREPWAAAWVGAAARERSRLKRKAELEREAKRLDAEIGELKTTLGSLDAATQRARSEAQSLRGADRAYLAARNRQQAADVAVELARSAVRAAEDDVTATRVKRRDARLAATSFQREHDLPDRAARQALAEDLAELRSQLRELLQPADRLARNRRGLVMLRAKLTVKQEALASAESERGAAEEERTRLAGELAKVRELEGPQLLNVQDELDATRRALAEVHAALKALAEEQTTLTKRSGVMEAQAGVVTDRSNTAANRLATAVEAMAALGVHGLLELQHDASGGAALHAARRLAAEPAPAETLMQLNTRVSAQIAELRETLSPSRGYVVSQEHPGDDRDVIVVTVTSSVGRQPVSELAQELGTQLDGLKASISDSEQQLMRKWIVDGLADALAIRLAEVREQVERTNRVLARCPTHFGIRVGLRWEVESEAPEALRETVDLLRRGPGMLDADAQSRLGTRLQELIDAERDRGEGTTSEQIARALDYRQWHRYWVLVTRDGGPTRKLTNRQLVSGSGGERAIMLQLPLLAAVAGFFDGAAMACPRALVLDEAFEGIDDAHARQMLDVLGELDLDFMMASYKLRPFVPTHRFALINLRRFRSQRVVVGQRSVWTGSQLLADDDTP